jgi:hypothetical protein
MTDWIGAANRESHTYPVLSFRESVQKLGCYASTGAGCG